MTSKWAYILIGDDKTGKTTFQKYLILHLCGIEKFDRLNTNLVHQINHRSSPRKLKTLFTINRSIQEKMSDTYETIDNYFLNFFKDSDISILSSHSHQHCINDIRLMIEHLNKRYYNVCAVFFTNNLNTDTEEIAKLNWNEKLVINNPINNEYWENQIKKGSEFLAEAIIKKAIQY